MVLSLSFSMKSTYLHERTDIPNINSRVKVPNSIWFFVRWMVPTYQNLIQSQIADQIIKIDL
ncbi:CLUMA_CG001527, isoform A [Clunio marinus]|uniref:CLUMA_CG001527, isoform A n=1 Tax=Clunio marinus TaxID=568069 RepID=A0A1J1HNC5_9DIPT|nr:CLUMA_CG001527, isoform A [Clunio marinus]